MSADRVPKTEITLTVDGRELTVPAGTLVIRAADQIGIYVPRFCDHPYLAPLGACRQCLVEVEGQRKPLTACTTRAEDGMIVKTQWSSELARDAQEAQLEFLLINHPLDCPQCDKGGECPLQDQALAYGPSDTRFVDRKRRYPKPIPISPLVLLDRERCVLCARCTRFADEISADPFIELFERSALEQVAIFQDEPYESVFSGNVVQICPVGALTASTFRFRARPFDMTSTPSVCNRCASGCNLTVQERRGQVVRVLAADNAEVNDLWNCDKGRFGWAYVHHAERVTEPLVRKDGEFVAVSWAEAIAAVAEGLGRASADGGVGILSGGRLADEDAYALSRFARTVLRTNDVDSRLRGARADEDAVLAAMLGAPTATYRDVDRARIVLWAGGDVREESPILFLRLNKARKRGARLVEIGPRRSALGRIDADHLLCAPGTEAGALASLAGDGGANAAALLEQSGVEAQALRSLASALTEDGREAVVLAGEGLARSPGALAAAWNLACRIGARFGWVPRRAGARGELWAGLHPGLLPGGRRVDDGAARRELEEVWRAPVPAVPGRDARGVLADAGALGALYLVAADPARDFADATLGAKALDEARFVVAQDMFLTESSRKANVVLPAAAVAERVGTLTDWEGRAQPFAAAVDPAGICEPDWEILARVAEALGKPFPSSREELRREMDALRRAPAEPRPVEAPPAALRRLDEHYPFALVVRPLLIDAGTMMVGSGPLLRTAEPPFVELNTEDAAAKAISPGDAVRVASPCGEITAPARLNAGLARRAVAVPAVQDGVRAAALIDAGEPVTLVRVEKA